MIFPILDDYFVDDLICEKNNIIFILESPHTQEVKDGYPVAGKSGVDISRILYSDNTPFGKLVFDKTIDNIGLLNISNYPLQESPYKIKNKLFEHFRLIRQNPLPRKKNIQLNKTINILLNDFYKRLIVHKDKKIVLCGKFVQSVFYHKFNTNDFFSVLNVPHPSFNNWHKDKYKNDILKLKEFIK
jgi:hypothetical protein